MESIRIFVSSPGDVPEERQIAGKVIERLQGKYWSFARLDDIFWEEKAIRATAHFQDELISPADCEIVVGILWSRLGTPLPEKFRKANGDRWESGTELELETSFEAYVRRRQETDSERLAKPDILVYRRREKRSVLEDPEEEKRAAFQEAKLEAYLRSSYLFADGSIRRPIRHYRDVTQFEQMLLAHLEELVLRLLPALQPGYEPPPISGSPFKGLQSFGFADSDRYFGRNREIRRIQARLHMLAGKGSPFLLIYGGSGYGKSSLMCAGLATAITRPGGAPEPIRGLRRVLLQPAKSSGSLLERFTACLLSGPTDEEREHARLNPDWPLHGLAELESEIGTDAEWSVAALLANNFGNDEGRPLAAAAVTEVLTRLDRHLFLQIDQLEEVFLTPDFSPAELRAFFLVIGDLIAGGRVWTVATMRSEYFPRVAEQEELYQLVGSDGGFNLGPPDRQSLREIIRYPAMAARLGYERSIGDVVVAGEVAQFEYLDDQILADAEASRDALPLLEFTLQQLYEGQRDRLLTWASYVRIGGLKGSIARRAQEVYERLPEPARQAKHRVFAALVHLDATFHTVARQRASMESLSTHPGATTFLKYFLDAHLLVTDEDRQTGLPVIALAHDALFSHWAELAQWIQDHHKEILARQRLREQAALWLQSGRKRGFLLVRASLQEAEKVARSPLFTLEPHEQQFLRNSQGQLRRTRSAVAGGVVALVMLGFAATSFMRRATGAERRASETDELVVTIGKQKEEAEAERRRQESLAEAGKYFSDIRSGMNAREEDVPSEMKLALERSPMLRRDWEWGHLSLWADSSLQTLRHDPDPGGYSGSEVLCAAFHPQGTQVATGGWDGVVRLWDPSSGKPLATLPHPSGSPNRQSIVRKVAFSPDGRQLATIDSSLKSRIWDTVSHRELATLSGHTAGLLGVAFAPDGSAVVTWSEDKTARIWDAKTGRQISVCEGHQGWVGRAIFSPDGTQLLTCGTNADKYHEDYVARLWEVRSGRQLSTLDLEIRPAKPKAAAAAAPSTPDPPVNSLAGSMGNGQDPFGPSGGFVLPGEEAAGFPPGQVPGGFLPIERNPQLASPPDTIDFGQPVVRARPKGSDDEILNAAFSPDGTRILLCSGNAAVIRQADGTGDPVLLAKEESMSMGYDVAWSPDSSKVAIGDMLWKADTGELWKEFKGGSSPQFSPDGKRLLLVDGSKCRILDLDLRQQIAVLRGHGQSIRGACFSPDGKRVVTASADNTAKIWDGRFDRARRFLAATLSPPAISPDGTKVFVAEELGNAGTKLRGINLTTGEDIFQVPAPEGMIEFALTPDAAKLLVVADPGLLLRNDNLGALLEMRHAASGKVEATLTKGKYRIARVACSPDGRWILALGKTEVEGHRGWEERTLVELWNSRTGRAGVKLEGSLDLLAGVIAFSPDSTRVAIGFLNGEVGLWDLATGAKLATLKGHATPVSVTRFSPDGRHLLTAGSGGMVHEETPARVKDRRTARLWALDGGTCLATLDRHDHGVSEVGFVDGGKDFYICDNQSIYFWQIGGSEPRFQVSATNMAAGLGEDHYGILDRGPVRSRLAITPDGKRAHFATMEGRFCSVEIATGKRGIEFGNPQLHLVTSKFQLLPGGNRLVQHSGDGFKLWDSISGTEVAAFKCGAAKFLPGTSPRVIEFDSGHLWVWECRPYREMP